MAKQSNIVFLEEWLRSCSDGRGSLSSRQSSTSSARAIIQAWAELRDALQRQSFSTTHLNSLKLLLSSQTTLHVAEPQAKLLISILSSPSLLIPHESYPLFFRLLYIWVRKSFKVASVLIDSAVGVISNLFSVRFTSEKTPFFFSEGVLLLGAFSIVPSVTKSSRTVCLELLCRLVEQEYRLVGLFQQVIPDILAGLGYALSSAKDVHYVRILNALLGIWGKKDGPCSNVYHGLMILHLTEWVLFGFFNSSSLEKIRVFAQETLNTSKTNYVPFVRLMAAAGVLRACNRSASSSMRLELLEIVSGLKKSAEDQIESVAKLLNFKTELTIEGYDLNISLLLQCISLALARSGQVAPRVALLRSLASALLVEIFPLHRLYKNVLEFPQDGLAKMRLNELKEHLDSLPFKEAGTITSVFCNQYALLDDENKNIVENQIWGYCEDIYARHRRVALVLHGREDVLLAEIEKIAESAFLMVVVFASAVVKHRLNAKFAREIQMEISVRILVSFSCVEYFRRMRLPEYMDTIRGVVVSVQENDSACVSFVESIPSYVDLTNCRGFSSPHKMEYTWFKDDVQTARILFYIRVIPTCVEHLPITVFRRVMAPIMFLHPVLNKYMGHPNVKVARASHSLFASFTSSGKDSDQDDRVLLKEQLVFYYMKRTLEGYPGITSFEGMASGVVALVRHLPAGSPTIFYSIKCLVEKANKLCIPLNEEGGTWKNWQGESEPCKKILELLLRIISLVDVQVLPNLMKLMAELIIQLPKDGQNMVLNELYTQVAESDDLTRKPTLVSWLQSLSYLCSRATTTSGTGLVTKSLSSDEVHARL